MADDRTRLVRRRLAVGAALVVLALGQAASVALRTGRLWPFNPIQVYHDFSDPDGAVTHEAMLLRDGAEVNVAATPWAGRNVTLRFADAMERAGTRARRDSIAAWYFDYLRGRAGGALPHDGLRLYRRTWHLGSGRVVRAEVLGEFHVR